MNDEGQPGNRSVETADYLTGSRLDGDSHLSDDADLSEDADLDETGSFAAGSVQFLSPEIKLPSTPGFSLGSSDSSATSEEPAESAFSAEPEPVVESADTFDSFDTFDRFDSFEPSASFEPEADSLEPEADSLEPEDVSLEPEASAEPDAYAGRAGSVTAEPVAEPEARARPEYSDVFTKPAFLSRPDLSAEPESPAEPEPAPEPAALEAEVPAKPDYSDFFTRPTVFPKSEGDGEQSMPVEAPRFTPHGEPRYSGPKETRYTALDDPGFSAPAEGRRSFAAEPSFSAPKETPYSAPEESRYPAPGDPPPSFSAGGRYSGPKETTRSTPEEAQFPAAEELRLPPLGEPRYSGAKERRLSRPEETAIPAAPAEDRTGTAAEPANAETPEPAVTVEVPGKPAAQHPVRTTGELSVLRSPERPAGIESRLPDLWAYDGYPIVENAPADDQAGVVSLGYIGAAVKRKKKVWLLTTALGALVAAALFSTYHAKYTDTTTVLLALDPSLDAATAIQTDAILAVDQTMAQEAMQKLGLHETVPQFLKTYSVAVSTTTNDLLTFTATDASATAAYNEANTLATTFLQYRAQTELEKESANTAAQNQQVTQAQQAINSLNSQIRKLKANGASSTDSRVTRLETELTNAQTLLTSLQQNVAGTEATQRSTTAGLIAGSNVLDTGIPAKGVSQKKFALEYGGGTIFGGLVLGLLIVALGAIVSDRLRRRDDVAAALGAPVRVSVASGGGRLARKAGHAADLKRVAAHLQGAVPTGSDNAGSLAVVAVDDKSFASKAIRELAVTTAREGKRVVLVDLADGALGKLFRTKDPGIHGVDVDGVRMVLVTPEPGDLAPVGPLNEPMLGTPMNGITNVHAAADLFITLATVNSATGAAHLKTWADDAVAVVTTGASSVTKVQAAGEMIRFAGLRLTSAILLGADAKDETLGLVPV